MIFIIAGGWCPIRYIIPRNNSYYFQSKIVKLKVSKKPDKRHEELLASDSKDSGDGSLWNSITSTLTGINYRYRTNSDSHENLII